MVCGPNKIWPLPFKTSTVFTLSITGVKYISGSPYGFRATGMPSSNIKTLRLRSGSSPRIPMLTLSPAPSSSTTFSPGIFRTTSLALCGKIWLMMAWFITATEPGTRVSNLSFIAITLICGMLLAVVSASALLFSCAQIFWKQTKLANTNILFLMFRLGFCKIQPFVRMVVYRFGNCLYAIRKNE